MPDSSTSFPLARVIEDLRRELLEAVRLGEGQQLRFKLKPIEVELQMAMTREASGEGGIQFWVLSLGAKADMTDSVTHTLKLSLDPVGENGGERLVAGTGTRER